MKRTQVKQMKKRRRHNRIRAKVVGSATRPRLAVFKSNRYIYAQLIDDSKGVTLASSDSSKSKAKSMVERAEAIGADIAKQAASKKITKVVFDRGGFIFTGRVKSVAEAARKAGLVF